MQLHQSFEDVLFQKTLSFQHSMTVYPRRYLLPDAKDSSPLSSTSTQSREVIDTIDHQLLQAVAALPGSSQRELAEHLGVSPTMIDVRLRRLRERGILIGMVLALAPHELGVTEYKLILRGRGTHPQLAPAIHRIAQTNPHVTYVIECLGGWDFEIGVESDDPRDVSTLTQLLLFEFGRFIEAITMLTKVHDHKQRWYPGPATVGKLRARAP
jgi:DNA-binding Lrp family transcriptional regulator